MRVEAIGLDQTADRAFLRAAVVDQGGTKEDLWFSVPADYAGLLRPSGEPFLAALLLPAMLTGQRLELGGPISSKLLAATQRIQDIYGVWLKDAKHISIQAAEAAPPPRREPGQVGAFFSGGVDSFYTLLKNLDRVGPLVFIDDFGRAGRDNGGANPGLLRAAGELGKVLIEVRTNILRFGVRFVDWNFYHGAALAAVGLLLQDLLEEVLIPAGVSYPQIVPWGTHPLLDPLWSTENTRFCHDGCEISWGGKVADWISRSGPALAALRVCDEAAPAGNCGRCEKCLRAMIALQAAGVLDRCATLPKAIPAAEVRRLRLDTPILLEMAEENLVRLESLNTSVARELRSALRTAIKNGRRIYARRFLAGSLGES